MANALKAFATALISKSKPTGPQLIVRNYAIGNTVATSAGLNNSTDNLATAAFLTIGPDSVQAPYLASYTPVTGHMVAVLFIDGSPLILGRVIGLPNI